MTQKIVRTIRDLEGRARRISYLNERLIDASKPNESNSGIVDLATLVQTYLSEFEMLLPARTTLRVVSNKPIRIEVPSEPTLLLVISEAVSVVSEYVWDECQSEVVVTLSLGDEAQMEIEYAGITISDEDLRSLSESEGVIATVVGRKNRSALVLRFQSQSNSAKPEIKRVIQTRPLALLAEDESVLRLAIQSMLESIGYDVVVAENGSRAVDRFHERTMDYSLVLVDLHMPQIGGDRVVESIRSVREELPIIKMSGDDRLSVGEAFSFSDPCSCFLAKPFGISHLRKTISSFESLAQLSL